MYYYNMSCITITIPIKWRRHLDSRAVRGKAYKAKNYCVVLSSIPCLVLGFYLLAYMGNLTVKFASRHDT